MNISCLSFILMQQKLNTVIQYITEIKHQSSFCRFILDMLRNRGGFVSVLYLLSSNIMHLTVGIRQRPICLTVGRTLQY